MSDEKKFSEPPLASRIMMVALGIPVGAVFLALIAVGAGFLWKAVQWAWS